MDIDDTLTTEGKMTGEAFSALWRLKEAGLVVIPVTGRPAGWCDMIAREWPCDGVVGENGALVFYEKNHVLKQIFHPNAVRNEHPTLLAIKERVLKEVPGTRLAKDQPYRMFDIAIDFAEEEPILPLSEAEKIKTIALDEGAKRGETVSAKISSIHVNIWMGAYSKLDMSRRFLNEHFGWNESTELSQVVFVGDSPNDEPMFEHFPMAAAVANINKYKHLMHHLPGFIASKECGAGFTEIAKKILNHE
jgi:HAD superfamily hydrolase (TIGR01484 family)